MARGKSAAPTDGSFSELAAGKLAAGLGRWDCVGVCGGNYCARAVCVDGADWLAAAGGGWFLAAVDGERSGGGLADAFAYCGGGLLGGNGAGHCALSSEDGGSLRVDQADVECAAVYAASSDLENQGAALGADSWCIWRRQLWCLCMDCDSGFLGLRRWQLG